MHRTYGLHHLHGVGELDAIGTALAKAHERGHDLGEWRIVEDRMRFAVCRLCCRLVWIVRPPGKETWYVDGCAFNADCE